MSLVADREQSDSRELAPPEIGCSIELKCDANAATLIVRGALDIWSLAGLDAQLDQLRYTSSKRLTIDLHGVSEIEGAVVSKLVSFAHSITRSERSLSIMCRPSPVAGWLYAAGIHRFALLECV